MNEVASLQWRYGLGADRVEKPAAFRGGQQLSFRGAVPMNSRPPTDIDGIDE
ncbi:MAG: hypothetical protein ACR2P3_06190 [Geminicoccaceae bacterium]